MMKHKKCGVHMVAFWLLIIGGFNWGLVGAFDWNLVEVVFGTWPIVVTIIYIVVGLAAIATLLEGTCKACEKCEVKKK